MPAFDQFGLFLLAAVTAGLVIGALLYRSLSGRHAHYNEVRWRRRFSELQAEHELRIATLTKTLRHAEEKQATLRQALDESDETIRLLSAEGSTTFEQDIADRNSRIGELKTTLSHARAMLADAQDHEAALQRRVGELQNELADRDRHSGEPEACDAEQSKPASSRTNVVSIHEHALTDDLVGSPRPAGQTEQRIRALESELDEWKRKYEAANGGGDRSAFDADSADDSDRFPGERSMSKDDLQRIRGIGPALESALNKLGFFQYEQLADMGQHDIEQMRRHDHSLPGRIRRYKWVEQARELQKTRQSGHQNPDI